MCFIIKDDFREKLEDCSLIQLRNARHFKLCKVVISVSWTAFRAKSFHKVCQSVVSLSLLDILSSPTTLAGTKSIFSCEEQLGQYSLLFDHVIFQYT